MRSSSEVELMKMSWGPLVAGGIGIVQGRLLVDCSPVGEPLWPAVPKPSRMRYLAKSAAEGGFRSGWGVAPADEWCEAVGESWTLGSLVLAASPSLPS